MTSEQVKELLAVYRPGTEDEFDPIFAEALARTQADPVLKQWFEESMAFDQGLRAAVGQMAAPSELRTTILTRRKIIRPAHWYHRRMNGRELAAAALLLFTLTLAAFWLLQKPVSFVDFQREIADQSWGTSPHVALKSSSLGEVKSFLASHQISTNFDIPPTLAQSDVHGCSIMHWQGRRIPVLCFNSQRQHVHLLVVDRNLFPDAPSRIPQAEQWETWRTVSWSKDAQTYVLTGLSTPAFVKKFRKAGRWDWES
jgi:hypothetical protein